jgi:hypothetical protein
MATYLNLINKVLIRLRETEALTPIDSEYVQLVGMMVNDAKKLVEDSWDWSNLRTTKTVSATVGDATWTLTGVGHNYKFLDAINATSRTRMKLITQNEMNTRSVLNSAAQGSPYEFSLGVIDSNGDQAITVYPVPDGSYTLQFDLVVREDELENASDTTILPIQPIVLYAWAMATRERGETGGMAAQEIFSLADRALADAIGLEASRYQAELTWRQV